MKRLLPTAVALLYLSGCASFKPMDCTRLEGAEHQKTCEQHNIENKAVADAANDKVKSNVATALVAGAAIAILSGAARALDRPSRSTYTSTTACYRGSYSSSCTTTRRHSR